jgi:alanine dehydrogenase
VTEPSANLLFLSEADTEEILNWPDVIASLAAAYQAKLEPDAAPPRVVARMGTAWLRVLAAMSHSGRHMGVKIIGRAREPRSSYLIPLWDQESAELVCLVDGKHVTAMRTAGTSVVAADRLLAKAEIRVGVLGAGQEAMAHASAIATVRRVTALTVYSPTPASRDTFARKFSTELGIEAKAVESASAAIADVDLIIAAARSRDETPILRGEWLRPGTMVISVGSTLPEQHEIDPESVRRADLIVVDVPEEVADETGDMLEAQRAGIEFASKMVTLADVVQGRCTTRQQSNNIVMFKSVGSATQDIAVAEMCFEKAVQLGFGTRLPVGLVVKGKK